jgi:hypothetical protein
MDHFSPQVALDMKTGFRTVQNRTYGGVFMERDFETNSSHLVPSRTTLWCPVCGAEEGKGCKPVKGLRFASHDAYATGTVIRPVILPEIEVPIPRLQNRLRMPQRWLQ